MKTTMQTVTSHAITVVVTLLIAIAGCLWMKFKPSLPSVLATPAAELAKEKPTLLTCKPVLVYRDKVETKLGLPSIVTGDPNKHVTASTKVPGDEYPHTVTSVYDQNTGATDMFVRKDKLPWLELKSKWRAGVYYGINDADSGVILGQAQYEFLQLKRLKATAIGQVDSSSRWFGGVGVSW